MMLNSAISNVASGLQRSHERLEASANRVANQLAPTDDTKADEVVSPATESSEGRETRAEDSEDTRVDSEKFDHAREVSEQIESRRSSEAQLAVIQRLDETLGSVIDVIA